MSERFELLRLLGGGLPAENELAARRDRRLRALIADAYARVPYYRALLDGAGVRPREIRGVADLGRIPISTRESLRAAGDSALAVDFDRRREVTAATSGSTGSPWTVRRTRSENRLRRALELRSMRAAGIRPRDLVVTLGPNRAVPWRLLDRFGLFRVRQVSPLLSIEQQIERLRALRPTVLWFYPTALRSLLEVGGDLADIVRPRLLVYSAEALDEPLRRRIGAGERFPCRNFYGSVEIGRIAWECDAGDGGLHVNADWVVLEQIADDDLPGAGRSVVVTSLLTRAMPFVRYRLGDRCELLPGACPCGVSLPRIRPPVGREWEALRLPSGRPLSPWGLNFHLRSLPGLLQFRFTQETPGRIVLALRFAAPPAATLLEELRATLLRHLAEPVDLEIELVERFDDPARKFRTFVSSLPPGA